MITTSSVPTPTLHAAGASWWPVARELALAEARRLVLHPLVLLGAGLYCAMIVVSSGEGPGSGYDGLVTGPTFFMGVFTYFAAHLVASRPRRHRCLDQQACLPAPPDARTAGLCVAAFAPAVFAVALSGITMAWYAAGRTDLPVWPSAGELAAGPLTVLGAALLGTMVARWLPFATSPVLVIVAVVALTFILNEAANGRYALLSPYTTFSVYVDDGSWAGKTPGSPGWHAAYLASLCGMAAAGSLLRDARRRSIPLAAGAALTGIAAIAGLAQLP